MQMQGGAPIGPMGLPMGPSGPTVVPTKTKMVAHQMTGPGLGSSLGSLPTHMFVPGPGPEGSPLLSMRLVAVAHAHPSGKMSAALLASPTQADLKKGKGCRAFVKGSSDDEQGEGDCFLEEYENGYNEEQSKKTFFGGDQSNSKHEKDGARSSKRYKNESKFVHHPQVKHQWVRTPDGLHQVHLVRTEVGPLYPAPQRPAPQRAQSGSRGAARPGQGPSSGKQMGLLMSSPRGSNPPPKEVNTEGQVTVIRLPPGTATVVMRPAKDEAAADDQDDEEESENVVQEDEDLDPQREEDAAPLQGQAPRTTEDGLVEVFKHSARSAPLVADSPTKPVWVQEYSPLQFKQVTNDRKIIVTKLCPSHETYSMHTSGVS